MELTSIYTIISIDVVDKKINAMISFNKKHPVFEGHFPGNPIVPGVVQVKVMKDLLESALHKMIFLNRVKLIKCINVINPVEDSIANFEIEFGPNQLEHDIWIKCVVKIDTLVYMKYSGSALVSD